MHAAIDFRQRRDLGDVLNATFLFLRQNLRPMGRSLLYLAARDYNLYAINTIDGIMEYRFGARPMPLPEMQRLYLREGKIYTVRETPP